MLSERWLILFLFSVLQTKISFYRTLELKRASRYVHTTKYVRISIFVVCGLSIRLHTLTTMAIIPDCSGCYVPKFQSIFLAKGGTEEENKTISSVYWGGKLSAVTRQGLYLPQIWTSMYVVTVTQKLLGYTYWMILVLGFRIHHENKETYISTPSANPPD